MVGVLQCTKLCTVFVCLFVFFVVVVVFLFDLGLTSLSTIFQSYRDGVCGRELKAHF